MAVQIPGPGAAAFISAGLAAWAASQTGSGDPGGWLLRVALVALAFFLVGVGYYVEVLHRPKGEMTRAPAVEPRSGAPSLENRAGVNPQSGAEPGTTESYSLLYVAALQKFLAFAVIGATTFIGYVELAVAAHVAVRPSATSFVLQTVALFLMFVIAAAVAAAARQYYLIAKLEMSRQLSLRRLERELTRDAAPFVRNTMELVHGLDDSAMKKSRRLNALTGVAGIILVALVLIFVFAIT